MAHALIVDDDPASARLVQRHLQRAGHEVVVRFDGRAGLEEALRDPPEVVILDVIMPVLDGLAVCRELRAAEQTRDVPVIFLSARSDIRDRVVALDQGAVDYLVKPFAPDELMARVRAALRTRQLQEELRAANAQLRAADQNRQELVSMLAHDIRGLLGAISSAVEMARLDLDELPPRDAHRFLGIAERNAADLIDLTTNLLDTYRLDEGRLHPRHDRVDLAAVVADVVDRLAGQAQLYGVRLRVLGDLPEPVLGDAALLDRVLLNLVTNALKFSPPGGGIVVELGARLTPPGGERGAVVAVHDQVPGIAPEDRRHLFERFTPLALPGGKRPVGSGLGLAFCQKVIRLMGGTIWVESEPGRGTTFAFVLRRADPVRAAEPDVEPSAAPVGLAR